LLVAGEIYALHAEPETARARMRRGMVCRERDRKRVDRGAEDWGRRRTRYVAVAAIEDWKTSVLRRALWARTCYEVGEGIVKIRLRSGHGQVCYPLAESMD
jgi:hypothetical protein